MEFIPLPELENPIKDTIKKGDITYRPVVQKHTTDNDLVEYIIQIYIEETVFFEHELKIYSKFISEVGIHVGGTDFPVRKVLDLDGVITAFKEGVMIMNGRLGELFSVEEVDTPEELFDLLIQRLRFVNRDGILKFVHSNPE